MKNNGVVNLSDLPEKIHVILNPRFRDKLMKEFMKIARTKYRANKMTGISRTTLNRMIKNKNGRIKIDFLLRIARLINKKEFSLNEIEKRIAWVGHSNSQGIINPKLPFNFNSREGARFLAAICNEGWISAGAYYSNSSQELRDSVTKDTLSVFGGDDDAVREWIKEKDQYLAFPSVIRDVLVLITKFKGVKSENNPPIPSFILKDKDFICGWIEQTIADEGHVKYHENLYRREINWKRSFSICLKEYKLNTGEMQMLKTLGITYNIYDTDTYKTKKGIEKIRIRINITGRENLLKLREIVHIPMKRKEELFIKMMKGFVRYKEPIRIKDTIRKICKRNGYVTSTELKKKMGYKDIGVAGSVPNL